MRERTLEISEEIFVEWGEPERDQLKARLTSGLHVDRGHRYRIIKDAVPDDAVLSIPERDEFRRVLKYHVLSDEFTDGDPSWLTPVGASE